MTTDPFRIDRLSLQYLDAIDSGDLHMMTELLELAETDAEWDAALGELLDGLAEAPADTVRDLLKVHLPTGHMAPMTEVIPVTIGEVASRLKLDDSTGKSRMMPADQSLNDALTGDATAVPDPAEAMAFNRWITVNPLGVSTHYRRLFRSAAVMLWMGRAQQATRLAAARPVTPPRRPRKPGDRP